MITLSTAQIDAWIALYAFPLFRILAFISVSPLWGTGGVPRRIRLLLGLSLALLIAPVLPPMPDVSPASVAGFGILLTQTAVGLAMGFAVRIVFAAIDVAGEYIGYQMGLGFATFYDPVDSAQTPVMAEFMTLIGILIFLSANGHLVYVSALAESFHLIPVAGLDSLIATHWYNVVKIGSLAFALGLLLALPVLIALLMTNVALAVLTRAAPQLNIFALGFPLTLLGGFFLLWAGMPYFVPGIRHIFDLSLQSIWGVFAP